MTLSTETLQAALQNQPRLKRVEHFTTLGSTNDLARYLAQEGAPEITLLSTDEQTTGRGRQGRSWYTPRGSALAVSLLTRPSISAQHAMLMTMLAGLAVVEGIEDATGLKLDLKWPNDVVAINNDQLTMHNEKAHQPSAIGHQPLKVGGILTECSFQSDRIEYAVVGMGINVNVDFSQQPELRNIATSLMELKGEAIDRLAILTSIVTRFIDLYPWLNNEVKLRDAWRARLMNLGHVIRVRSGDEVLEGLAEAVDVDGALLLRSNDGQVHRLLSGDVTLSVKSDE